MDEIQLKRDKFVRILKNYNFLESFEESKGKDCVNFLLRQRICQNVCTVLVTIDDSFCTNIAIFFGSLNNVLKREKVLELINTLNMRYKLCKYFLDDEDNIILQTPYIATVDKFDGETIFNTMTILYRLLEEQDYSKFMKIMWS